MKPIRHTADTLFTVLLLLSFALSALLLAAAGAAIYKNSTTQLEENYTSRTAAAYVTEKLRQHDQCGTVSLTEFNEIPALCLQETIQEESFCTYIYYFDGALRELFIRESDTPSAVNGTEIAALSSFTIEERSDSGEPLLQITAQSEHGQAVSSVIHLSSQ